MIITRIQAENVLKYSALRLEDLPAKGLIAVVGDNESGKSSIGESICFGLFGRTFSLGPDELDKVIRWGESRCAIKLDFTTPDGGHYQVARFLDELGNHGASISRPGERPLVRGVDAVAETLQDLIGFGYTEFIESFYLAQREISTPKPHSDAVKAMAGIDSLERVSATCAREGSHASAQRADTERERADIAAQIAALDLDPLRLGALQEARSLAQSDLETDRERIAALKQRIETSDSAIADVKDAAGSWLARQEDVSYFEHRRQGAELQGLLAVLGGATEGDERARACVDALGTFAADFDVRLDAFDGLRDAAGAHRDRLGMAMGLTPGAGATDADPRRLAEAAGTHATQPTFAGRHDGLDREASGLRRGRIWNRFWTLLVFLLAATLWAGWGLVTRAPVSAPGRVLSESLGRLPADWTGQILNWAPFVAAAATLVLIGLLLHAAGLGRRLRATQGALAALAVETETAAREYADLERLDQMPLPEAVALLGGLNNDTINNGASEFAAAPGRDLLERDRYDGLRRELKQVTSALVIALTQIKASAGQAADGLHELVANHAGTIARLDTEISQEEERVRRHQELTEIGAHLEAKRDALARRVRVRELAVDLLAGAIHYISQRFNTEVRNLSAESLPKFTNGRYQHLQIDQNLKVKAFSNEKRDFMDLDEISSGTQRQIMLAVRLALSQKLVNSVIQGPQLLFLDEPFAFFDETRTASALAVLPQVSRDFTQIWVTSQTFPAASRFDLSIECDARESGAPSVRRPTAN